MPDTDIRVLEAQAYFSDERARDLLKFGNAVADAITLCHVRVRVENRLGQIADGWGAIFLSYLWAFREPGIEALTKDTLMRRVTERFCQRVSDFQAYTHPIDLFVMLEDDLKSINADACAEMNLPAEMPFLGVLVCASPVDAAVHDAFGKVNGISSYDGLGPEYCQYDLSRYLGDEFRRQYVSDYIRPSFVPQIPIFHVVGGLDKLRSAEADANDADHPASLEQWIARDGVYCFKIKPRGDDMEWDLDRVVSVYQVAAESGLKVIHLSLDANEQCESPAYMVELLHRIREVSPEAFNAILYLEQPTERDMRLHRFDMRELAALKPVFVDESLTSLADMDLALDLGWSGVALKTCKCHSLDLLLAARCTALQIPYVIQDLTNPGIALLQSVGLAARLSPLLGVEANARQYYPHVSAPEAAVHPDIVRVRNGEISTHSLSGPGLGYQLDRINRPIFAQT